MQYSYGYKKGCSSVLVAVAADCVASPCKLLHGATSTGSPSQNSIIALHTYLKNNEHFEMPVGRDKALY